jgi:hypothetical protein
MIALCFQEVLILDLILRNKSFRLLLTGSLISGFGDYLYDIAITLLVYDISKSIDAIAYMWISKAALRMFILYAGGIITDKFNRKLIITIINLISAPIALMFILVDKNTLWIAYLGVFLLQSLNDIDNCSENAILPELVQREDIPRANTIFSFTNQILMFVSLAVSGFIYKLVGSDILFAINGFSFLLSGICFSFIKYQSTVGDANKNVKIFDISVLDVLKKAPVILVIILSSMTIAVIARIYDVTNISIADIKLHLGSSGIIYFRYAMAIGGLLTPAFFKLKLSKNTYNSYIVYSISLICFLVAFALSSNVFITLLILAGFGLTSSLQAIYFRSMIQENTSVDYLGRVFSFYRIVMTAVSLVTVSLIPALNAAIGVERLFVFTGIPALVIFVLLYYSSKKPSKDRNVSV